MNIHIKKVLLWGVAFLGATLVTVSAQEPNVAEVTHSTNKRAWEIGFGVSGFHMPRAGLKNINLIPEKGYLIDIMKRDILWGGQVYVARELSDYLALDLQGSFAYAKDPIRTEWRNHYVAMADLGMQWRLGNYFDSKFIDPFIRVGAGYMHKNFRHNHVDILDGFNLSEANVANEPANDPSHLFTVTSGIGVNMWLNDKWGIALQADYLHLPHQKIPNTFQGTVRLTWRIGGKTKKSFVRVPVEKIVEREVVRVVEKQIPAPPTEIKTIYKLFSTINFAFDKSEFTPSAQSTLDEIAELLKQNSSMRFCVIGCTDKRGSQKYNKKLSEERARKVVEALIKRGVPSHILKWRGVGKSIAYAPSTASDEIRRGDRKIIVEVIDNSEYWSRLK